MAYQQKVVYILSNGAIFNDLERPILPVSRSRHSLTLNISETILDSDVVSMKYLRIISCRTQQCYFNDLEWFGAILYRFQNAFVSGKSRRFYTWPVFSVSSGGDPVGISRRCLISIKLEGLGYRVVKNCDDLLSRFDTGTWQTELLYQYRAQYTNARLK